MDGMAKMWGSGPRGAVCCGVMFMGVGLAWGCSQGCSEQYLAGFTQERADAVSHGGFRDAQAFGGGAVAVGDDGLIVRFGTDGLKEVDAGADVDLHALILAPDLLAVGDGGTILRSSDGATWTAVDVDTAADLHDVAMPWHGDEIAVVGDDVILVSKDGGASFTALTGDAPPGPLRAVAYGNPGYLAFTASGDVFTVDADAGTYAPLDVSLGAAVRNVEYDAVGDAWFVLVDGTISTGYQEGGTWHFSPGGSSPCGAGGFRRTEGFTLCDDGRARERYADQDEPSLSLPSFAPARAAVSVSSSEHGFGQDGVAREVLMTFGEDGVARLYATEYDRRPIECSL